MPPPDPRSRTISPSRARRRPSGCHSRGSPGRRVGQAGPLEVGVAELVDLGVRPATRGAGRVGGLAPVEDGAGRIRVWLRTCSTMGSMVGRSRSRSSRSSFLGCIDMGQYAGVSILVNIEDCRYAAVMTRTRTTSLDPEVRLLAALADPTRLAIVRQLAQDAETCACDFTSCCDVGQPTVSHHLRVLREAGVVTTERRGQTIWYRLAPETAERLARRRPQPGARRPRPGQRPGRRAEAMRRRHRRRRRRRAPEPIAGSAAPA